MRTARPSRTRVLLVLGTWLLGVALATAVGFGALQMIGDRVTDRATTPLSERAVDSAAADAAGSVNGRATVPGDRRPAAAATTEAPTPQPADDSPSPSASAGGSTTRSGQVRSFSTSAGVVSVRCENGRAVLRYAVPRVGYTSDVSGRGPQAVEVEFQGPLHHTHLTIRCVSGVPTATVDGAEDDLGGRDR